jgi:WD40 repeat protein
LVIHDLATWKAKKVPLHFSGRRSADRAEYGACALTPDNQFVVVCQTMIRTPPRSNLSCRRVDNPKSLLWSISFHGWLIRPLFFQLGGEQFSVFERDLARDSQGGFYVTRQTSTGEAVAKVRVTLEQFGYFVRSPDMRLIAGARPSFIGVFSADDLGAAPTVLRNESRTFLPEMAFHPSGRYLAATCSDGTLKLYNTTTWKVDHVFNWGIGPLYSVAFSPNGDLCAVAGKKGPIVLWDTEELYENWTGLGRLADQAL